ncbi:hypothetical protein WR25_14301 [Diploscapter pachys]|uniref:Ribosome assembly factor mrt4 n=1 Tax=Diploscapter pachys TaxID=2018661 RepID=A0A2A2KH58_9BILA|nr:hypothetical protein WR25_14301 [Diploscapter pachys]
MARSRRDKDVSLTKVKKKTRETKEKLVEQVHQSVDSYKRLFVFSMENLRSNRFIAIRQQFKNSSRFFFGKTSVLAIALGREKATEYAEQLHKVAQTLKGQCGLIFTNDSKSQMMEFFENLSESDYARAGDIAPISLTLPEGPLPQFAFSMEPQLRKLGMPTKLDKGIITLIEEFTVCTEGEPISVEQAKILKLLERKLSEFRVKLACHWSKKSGFEDLA